MPPTLQTTPNLQTDPIKAFLRREPPPQKPLQQQQPTLTTLRNHTAAYEWAQVLQQSTQLLSDDHHPPDETLLVHTFRALALLQTRQIQRCKDAITALGDISDTNPQYRYETYDTSKTGSFVPFLLHLLSIDIRFRHGDILAIADCYHLINSVLPQDKHLLLSALVSYLLKSGLYDTAIDVTKQLVALQNNDQQTLLILTRLYLHIYDLENAYATLAKAEQPITTPATAAHKGMIKAAEGDYEQALIHYQQALHDDHCWIYAMNNSAICLLHLGRLEDAVDMLENALRKDPVKALDEGLVFNLATLYQLAFPDCVVEKKRLLRKIAERFGRQGFDLEGVGL